MNDDEFIDIIAEIWVSNGGDAEGLDYLYSKLKQRIKDKEDEE